MTAAPPEWLEKLYDEHAEALYRYFLGATRLEADAKDLLQDLFVKIARRPDCLERITEVRAYLFRMAHNQVIDWARRIKVRRGEGTEPAEGLCLFAVSDDPDVAEFRRQLELALGEVPDDQSEAVRLKLWERMTFDEIAAAMGVPLNTAASRYRYGIEKLRMLLRPIYDELV